MTSLQIDGPINTTKNEAIKQADQCIRACRLQIPIPVLSIHVCVQYNSSLEVTVHKMRGKYDLTLDTKWL